MRHTILSISLLLSVLFYSCKKDIKQEFVEAYPSTSDADTNTCGYILKISGTNYAPINLPDQYKYTTGVIGNGNVLYINYTLLGDSLYCYYSNTFTMPPNRYYKVYPRIRIDKIL
jgi:hypothetical protein